MTKPGRPLTRDDQASAKTGRDLRKDGRVFPAADDDLAPGGVSWWQVNICGEDGDGNQATPFSNTISFGPVPA
jgi:hypothetical protein